MSRFDVFRELTDEQEVLHDLQQAGAISLGRAKVTVLDPERLSRAAR
ncbi:MAG: hypothetical protein Q8M22_13065 [Actinomycetota bacterium]|nr:hypothetical protein [Actinomycetota bacterium]